MSQHNSSQLKTIAHCKLHAGILFLGTKQDLRDARVSWFAVPAWLAEVSDDV